MAKTLGKTFVAISQLQCSGKPTGLAVSKSMKNRLKNEALLHCYGLGQRFAESLKPFLIKRSFDCTTKWEHVGHAGGRTAAETNSRALAPGLLYFGPHEPCK